VEGLRGEKKKIAIFSLRFPSRTINQREKKPKRRANAQKGGKGEKGKKKEPWRIAVPLILLLIEKDREETLGKGESASKWGRVREDDAPRHFFLDSGRLESSRKRKSGGISEKEKREKKKQRKRGKCYVTPRKPANLFLFRPPGGGRGGVKLPHRDKEGKKGGEGGLQTVHPTSCRHGTEKEKN